MRISDWSSDVCSSDLDVAGAQIDTIVVDFASLASVRACGDEAVSRFAKIDLLINNAGVMACALSQTEDGFEMPLGPNPLGHSLQTGKASCRERVCQSRLILVDPGTVIQT